MEVKKKNHTASEEFEPHYCDSDVSLHDSHRRLRSEALNTAGIVRVARTPVLCGSPALS